MTADARFSDVAGTGSCRVYLVAVLPQAVSPLVTLLLKVIVIVVVVV